MSYAPDLRRGIGRSQGKPDSGQERNIRKVIPHVRHLLGREAVPAQEAGKEFDFVFDFLVNLLDSEVGHPGGNRRRGPPGEDRDPKPGPLGRGQGEPVLNVKDFLFLAARAVVKPAVGEDAVNVKHQEADGAGSAGKRPGRSRGATGVHTILARRMSWR